MASSPPARTRVFISYSHTDAEFLQRLQVHLAPEVRNKRVDLWDDTKIMPGEKWKSETNSALQTAKVAVLLVSADYLASDFIEHNELAPLLSAAESEKVTILPVLLKPCHYNNTPLEAFQFVNKPLIPLLAMKEAEREETWMRVAEAITEALNTPFAPTDLSALVPARQHTQGSQPYQVMHNRSHQALLPGPSSTRHQPHTMSSPWLLSSIVIVGIFLLSLGVAWFLIQLGKIPQPWSGFLVTVFPIISSIGGLMLNKYSREFFLDIFKKLKWSDSSSLDLPPAFNSPSTITLSRGEEIQLEITELPARTEKATSYNDVFLFNEHLINPQEFFGRKQERITLLGRSRRGSSTSIIGPRRIGKTWLIEYLIQVAPDQLGPGYRVGYLNATMPRCDTVSGFTEAALESLGVRIWPRETSLNLKVLEAATKKLQEHNLIPILCIDEFEGFSNQAEFNLPFFRGLRAISDEGLRLVIASKRTLLSIVGNDGHTSGFFNIFEACLLKPFDEKDTREFIQIKGEQAKFSEQERTLLLKYGQQGELQWYPLRLQLAGKMLLDDKNAGSCRPNETDYQRSFTTRLEEKYQAVVEAQ